MVKATKEEGYDGKEVDDTERQWSVSGALLYSITVITTIGIYFFPGLLLELVSINIEQNMAGHDIFIELALPVGCLFLQRAPIDWQAIKLKTSQDHYIAGIG